MHSLHWTLTLSLPRWHQESIGLYLSANCVYITSRNGSCLNKNMIMRLSLQTIFSSAFLSQPQCLTPSRTGWVMKCLSTRSAQNTRAARSSDTDWLWLTQAVAGGGKGSKNPGMWRKNWPVITQRLISPDRVALPSPLALRELVC